ncbi:hypothetical protein O2N63_03115 [Aliiroseovarius sp. KMU-50]|uniref:Uncharacterized protein n=1 Tax=Aliiroseovarius salicola TaxID=3009082 RepID=A0ABT4VXS7_9RHOB|nr:hypothetical protein [Aliiroseovarius sp. KMU-50]MDA5093068.1 hypothetical protein [Aliiroseovarius sp. KMU-50]
MSAIPVPSFVWAFAAYLAASLFSALVNHATLGPTGLVYVARQAQYFVWFLIAAQFAPSISERTFKRGFGVIAGILLIWWIGELLQLVPKIGRFSTVGDRLTLNTSGPYETAILAVIIFFVAPARWQKIVMFAVLLATQSRITIAAFLVVWAVARPGRNALLITLIVPIALVFAAASPDLFQAGRLTQTQSPAAMLQDLRDRFDTVMHITSIADYRALVSQGLHDNVDYQTGDASFQVRAFKWALIIKSLGASTTQFLFGWGPGAWGLAVDGHYVRFLGEGGIVGFIAAMYFFALSLTGRDAPRIYRLGFFCMALSCIFIDAATSSKVMSTLWMLAGYFHSRRYRRSENAP